MNPDPKTHAIATAEKAVICMTMLEGDGQIADYFIDEGVTSNHFYHPFNAHIWEWIAERRSNNMKVSQLDFTIAGKDTDPARTNEILNTVETWSQHQEVCARLKDQHKSRCLERAIMAAREGLQDALPVEEVLDELRASMDKFDSDEIGLVSSAQFIPASHQQLIEVGDNTIGLTTGFEELDKIIDGMKPEDMIVLGARPGMGKSSIAINIADHVAVKLNKKTVIFSMEMTWKALGRRMISARSKVTQASIRHRQQNFDSDQRVTDAVSDLAGAPLWIYDRKTVNMRQIASKCRSIKNKHGLDFVIIDYIQLIKPVKSSGRRHEDVDEISRLIKSLAGSLGIPIFALAQLNRDYEKEKRIPRMSDLREAGGIEQDADIIMTLYQDISPEVEDEYNLDILKQREGPIGKLKLIFKKIWTRFINQAREGETEPMI